MKTNEKVVVTEGYESPIVKLIEFEVEVGFAASSISEVQDIGGIEGVLWSSSTGNTY